MLPRDRICYISYQLDSKFNTDLQKKSLLSSPQIPCRGIAPEPPWDLLCSKFYDLAP